MSPITPRRHCSVFIYTLSLDDIHEFILTCGISSQHVYPFHLRPVVFFLLSFYATFYLFIRIYVSPRAHMRSCSVARWLVVLGPLIVCRIGTEMNALV